ncbi:MAG: M28 family peptidase [Planctomycetes bacterium]|nr:M28 family peptidase [Planctomycetota bacterium]
MKPTACAFLGLLLAPALVACCGGPPAGGSPPGAAAFDKASAFAYLEHQCRFGPRAPGTEGARRARAYLLEELRRFAPDVRELPFRASDPKTGRTYEAANLLARLHPGAGRRVILATHWDTRLWAENDPDPARRGSPILGANDGASGVAVLLELARLFSARPPPVGVDIVLFDAEDLGRPGSDDYCQGSRAFARGGGPLGEPRSEFAVVVDLVGDRDLRIRKETSSLEYAPELVDRIWGVARRLGLEDRFPDEREIPIKDDHAQIREGLGIPAVLLIDFSYGPRHSYFHTHMDTPDKCSPESLDAVGRVLAELVYGMEAAK